MTRYPKNLDSRSPIYHLVHFSISHPRWILGIALALTLGSWLLAVFHLELRTSNLDLVDRRLPEVARFIHIAETWGTPNTLTVVFEVIAGDADSAAPNRESPGREDPEIRRALAKAVEKISPRLAALEGVKTVIDRLPIAPSLAAWTGIDPYLRSRDGELALIFVQPVDSESRADLIAPFVRDVRRVLDEADLPSLGLRAGLTGMPAYALDDRNVIERDITRLSGFGFGLVGLFVMFSFADRRRPLLVMAMLIVGLSITLGVTAIWPGHMTLLSAFFASILFGLGVDFGIHSLDRLEELETSGGPSDLEKLLPRALGALGPALGTGAVTSSAIFFAMLAGGFRGFAELGFIAGVGVLLCLVATWTLLPALIVIFGTPTPRLRHRRLGQMLAAWHRGRLGPIAAWTLGALLFWAAFSPPPAFDADYLQLQPADSESVRLERELVRRSDYSPAFAVFEAKAPGERIVLEKLLRDEASIGALRAMPSPSENGTGGSLLYAFPAGDIWQPETRDAFLDAARAIDPEVTGLPFLGDFMIQRTWRAVEITAFLGAILLLICVGVSLRRPLPALLAVLPAFGTIAALHGLMRWFDLAYNPLDLMALPVVLGIAVDDGVHIVHRFLAEGGDLDRTLIGSGRAVFLTSMTTLAAFSCLVLASHRGLASFAAVLCLGVFAAMLLSLFALPELLRRLRPWLVGPNPDAAIEQKEQGGRVRP